MYIDCDAACVYVATGYDRKESVPTVFPLELQIYRLSACEVPFHYNIRVAQMDRDRASDLLIDHLLLLVRFVRS